MPNTLTLRVNAKTRQAAMEGLDFVELGDTLRVMLTEAMGVGSSGSGLEISLHPKTAGAASVVYATGFTAVSKQPGTYYKDVTVASPALQSALAAIPPGDELALRLYIRDTVHQGTTELSGFTYVDMDLPVRNNPLYDTTSVPTTGNPYVTQSQLANLIDLLDTEHPQIPDTLVAKSDILLLAGNVNELTLDTLEETNAALKALLSGLITICS